MYNSNCMPDSQLIIILLLTMLLIMSVVLAFLYFNFRKLKQRVSSTGIKKTIEGGAVLPPCSKNRENTLPNNIIEMAKKKRIETEIAFTMPKNFAHLLIVTKCFLAIKTNSSDCESPENLF